MIDPDGALPVPGLPKLAASAGRRDLAAVVATVTAVSLPSFLVATLAVQIRGDLHFGPAILGVVVGAASGSSALFAIPSGSLAERVGGVRTLRAAAVVAAAALLAIALWAHSWPVLAGVLVVAGAASSAAQTSSNLFLSRRVAAGHQGLAFGIKQSSVPLAFLLGGAAVPAIALTVGWRWAFVAAAGLALAAAAALPPSRTPLGVRLAQAAHRPRPEPAGPLIALAVGFALALTACSSLSAFLVSSSVAAGVGSGAAGLVAVLASLSGITVRVLTGARADRRGGRHLPAVATMIAVGAVGFVLLAVASALRSPAILIPGAVVAFGIGWGWNGLFNFAVVRTHPLAPGRATGITQTGGRLGSVLGPLIFGLVVSHVGYAPAWGVASGEALAGAVVIMVGRGLLQTRLAQEAR
ncbi:MAG TPA: MFS transporter [Candidatus Nanopelagicaceae bacterium]|nr:MFS transporter [Candidatus Nanopelagicaceae bacterium]